MVANETLQLLSDSRVSGTRGFALALTSDPMQRKVGISLVYRSCIPAQYPAMHILCFIACIVPRALPKGRICNYRGMTESYRTSSGPRSERQQWFAVNIFKASQPMYLTFDSRVLVAAFVKKDGHISLPPPLPQLYVQMQRKYMAPAKGGQTVPGGDHTGE